MDNSLKLIILKHSILCWVQPKTAHSSEGKSALNICVCVANLTLL